MKELQLNKPLIDRLKLLDQLQPDTKRLWGKMSAQHMVEHLILAFRSSNGKLTVSCPYPPEKLPALKRFLLSSKPLPKEFVSPAVGIELHPLEYESIVEAKKILYGEVEDYYKYFAENPSAHPTNPTFGDLNKDEWAVFHEKHLTHHFGQFGITS